MKVVRVHDFETVRIEEAPVPAIGPEEALVAIHACGICSGDVTPWYINQKAPIVLGHEPAGEIVAVGKQVTRFQPGQRVFVHHHAPCLQCPLCLRGAHSMCETWRKSHLDPGGMAEFVRIPSINLAHDTLVLPDPLDYESGSFVEPVACAVKAFRRARFRKGSSVMVIGSGIMGQILVRLARHLGASLLLASDRIPFRLEKAQASGADRTIHIDQENPIEVVKEVTQGNMIDLVIVGPGSPEAIRTGIACAGRASTVLLFMGTPPGVQTPLEFFDLYFQEKDLICSYSCGPEDTREALDLLSAGIFPIQEWITHRFPLEKAEKAYGIAAQGGDSLKVMIEIRPPQTKETT